MAPLHINIKENAKEQKAIRAYWLVYERAFKERAWHLCHQAALTYMLDTGRMTEHEVELASSHPSGILVAQIAMRCTKARREDGDITIWSNPPKTWLGEPWDGDEDRGQSRNLRRA